MTDAAAPMSRWHWPLPVRRRHLCVRRGPKLAGLLPLRKLPAQLFGPLYRLLRHQPRPLALDRNHACTVYASSPGVRRHFCARCGTPMAFEGENWADELHFYAASLADPTAFQPTAHANWNEHLPWVKLADGLKLLRTPRRMTADEDFTALLALIGAAFASMKGRIDPPSSANHLTAADLAAQASTRRNLGDGGSGPTRRLHGSDAHGRSPLPRQTCNRSGLSPPKAGPPADPPC